ncbi:hypothetical protein [Nocardiopsis tropica]|uniref:Uncharacterized protein n=1 Tax=Nocardiopsis tropica TaxID=109330 RepID=A0ABU7KR20_9ACTN|nr:hypothetical protein [Nocardiopsis umidischolae]MEE2051746.1 hypothetical protein [Nocardiopsis umidischolae]
MTEIDIHHQQDTQIAAIPQPPAEHELVRWAHAARQAKGIAESLASTSFVPKSLQGNPHNIIGAILAGYEMGLQPMAALRSIDIIQGTPALRAHAMRGLVQSKGHEVQLRESTEAVCVMRGRRKGEKEWQEVTWTIERAQQLGLLAKDQWKKQPTAMLVARATGEICRLVASDVLHAMPYAREELETGTSGEAVPRVTVRELAPEAPQQEEQRDEGGLAADDPWNPKNSVGVQVEPAPADPWGVETTPDEDAAVLAEYEAQS